MLKGANDMSDSRKATRHNNHLRQKDRIAVTLLLQTNGILSTASDWDHFLSMTVGALLMNVNSRGIFEES